MCSSSTPSGRGFPWRSMSGNSGSALDASGMWAHKILISPYNFTKSNVCIQDISNNKKGASSFLNSPRNCWYCWTCVLMSTCPDPCCCCCCWPAPADVPLVIPSTLCTGFNLKRMQCHLLKLTVTSDPRPVQDPDTFCHPWTATHWCGSEVTAMKKGRIDYNGFWVEKNPKPVMTLWLHSHCSDKLTHIWFIPLTTFMSNLFSQKWHRIQVTGMTSDLTHFSVGF